MLDETTPADESATTPAESAEAPATKAAAKKTTARKSAAKKTTATRTTAKRTTKKAAASEVAAEAPAEATAVADSSGESAEAAEAPVKKAAAKRTRKAPAKKAAAETPAETPVTEATPAAEAAEPTADDSTEAGDETAKPAKKAPAKRTAKKATAKKTTTRKTAAKKTAATDAVDEAPAAAAEVAPEVVTEAGTGTDQVAGDDASDTLPLFQAPEPVKKATAKRTRKRPAKKVAEPVEETAAPTDEEAEEAAEVVAPEAEQELAATAEPVEGEDTPEDEAQAAEDAEGTSEESDENADEAADENDDNADESGEGTPSRRRRRRGGRRRRKSSGEGEAGADNDGDAEEGADEAPSEEKTADDEGSESGDDSAEAGEGTSTSRRRRRRRRAGDSDSTTGDDPENTVTRVRSARSAEDQITAVAGSTRLEAKKQRRREGREAGRRRAPIVSEAEFLARREAVERVMVIRQRKELTQIAVLEDRVLVEHYVARESQTSLIGNVYLGRVQNVLPSMEAAFIDIGKGRNAVLYAGEVNWSALGHKEGQPRKIESVLSPGQSVLVQVTKDPIGHKGARLTSQVSLAGRFLVYVPDGTTSGISRKLPDTERSRLKALLKEIVPDSAGVIVRTAAEGASEEELTRDVERLKARWEDIEAKSRGNAPQLLYGEPDLTLKVVRDLFTEDFSKLVIEGDDAWETVSAYVEHVAPDLAERVEKYVPGDAVSAQQGDVFATYRIDEQIAKGLDRKVWLPSGGSLIIDRTEAMTVVDVNTGKFTGSGGNLEETVTKNNLEAAEEIVRQLRLRDIGGIIVVDFIDMVLESNRDLVVRRLVECLGRDRTRHQVAEVTSLGLVQMTRKRIGTGLLEAFSTDCEHCHGRGLVTHTHPVEGRSGGGSGDDEGRRGRRRGRGRDGDKGDQKSDQKNEQKSDSGKGDSGKGGKGSNGSRDGDRSGRSQERDQKPEAPVAAPSPKEVAAMAKAEAAAQAVVVSEAEPTPQAEPVTPAAAVEVTPPVREPAAEKPAAEKPAEKPEAETPQAAPAEEAPAEAPAEDAKPKVVTRQRRGASRRTATTTSTPAVVVAAAPAATATPETPAPEPVAEENRPKVVTRTRGRAAARPAGPPSDAGAEESATSTDQAEPVVEHVPVKKKGTRKR